MSERDVPIGAVLAGKYRVERLLGQGGMGVVVEATQLDLERRVALKFLRKVTTPEATVALTRFEREARVVARLRGAHVVQIYDVGRLEHGEPFIVMELLHGEDLSQLLDREGTVSIATAVDYVLQACEAMAEAHVAGVVHRDLKPANLFLTRGPDGRSLIKVLDFGISKLMAADTTTGSLTSGIVGSPLYMSPEQLNASKRIDYRTDIWSLGAILYELISGKAAFEAEGLPQVCTRVMLGEPAPLGAAQRVPPALQRAILSCLAKAPESRPLSMADLALALLPFARSGSHRSAEAAIRITRGSNIPHGELPRSFDSLPPAMPAAPSTTPTHSANDESTYEDSANEESTYEDSFNHDRTVNISGPPRADLTQRELQPLVSAANVAVPKRPRSKLSLALLIGAAALALTLVSLVSLRGERSGNRLRPPDDSTIPGTMTSELSSSAPPTPAPQPSADPPAVISPAAPSSAPAAPALSASPAPAPRKVRPARPRETDPEELLKHR